MNHRFQSRPHLGPALIARTRLRTIARLAAPPQQRPRLLAALLGAAALLLAIPSIAGEARSRLLIDADTLARQLDDPRLVVLHLGDAESYAAGHIPGARLLPPDHFSRSRRGTSTSMLHELPDPGAFRMKMQQLGIARDSRVVVVFGNDEVIAAARAIWALEASGIADRVTLLDGGLPAWKQQGHPVSTEPRPFARSELSPVGLQPLAVDLRFLRDRQHDVSFVLLDVRPPEYWNGTVSSDFPTGKAPAGHMPGSINLPYRSVLTADGRFKSNDELRKLFSTVGVDEGTMVVVYCHSGLQSSAVVYAARLIGLDVHLYDGSYEEWTLLGMPVNSPVTANPRVPVVDAPQA